jgi:hypothetical protein
MGKKAAHSGESPKDRSANLMDKFISKNINRDKHKPVLPARRKDPNVPVDLWPLKDQIEYWNTRTEADRFNETYTAYSTWYDAVKQLSGIYPATFVDFTSKHRDEMKSMYENKTTPKQALRQLQKLGVY